MYIYNLTNRYSKVFPLSKTFLLNILYTKNLLHC